GILFAIYCTNTRQKINMLVPRLTAIPKVVKRNIGIVAPALQKASDPIQQLFLDKIREYKSKCGEGKLVDASPEITKELQSELDKLKVQYDAGSQDMTKFPDMKFNDPKVDTWMGLTTENNPNTIEQKFNKVLHK
ncbi:hypothetical protein KM043_018153, partial [Ampulex compressa]